MKKFFQRTSLLLAAAFIGAATMQAQKSPQDMDRFIDALIKRMTVEEKIGQLNLPVTGEITTGQAKSSDVAKKIEQGLVRKVDVSLMLFRDSFYLYHCSLL